ncbi:MAG: hypothetical protein KO202_03910 [Methanobacteriaceae archaeon]|jgi:hypothetical protein|nr:hypothetical protein [Methanobacteriaceae archaeon]
MSKEFEEIWTNYDRQVVHNYVEIRLHHYLFTKILKDHEEIVSKIIEITQKELSYFKLMNIFRLNDFKNLMNEINDFDKYFDSKNMDINQHPACDVLSVVKYIFEGILDMNIYPVSNKNFDKELLEESNDLFKNNIENIKDALKNPIFDNIKTPEVIDIETIERASKNTDDILNLVKIHEIYDQLFIFPNKFELYDVVVKQILTSLSNDKLFELYVLLNLLEVLGTTRGDITFQNAGVRELANYYLQVVEDNMEHTTDMQIFFHDLPAELEEKFRPILKYPYICIRMKNSVKVKDITRISYLLLEIERITDNQLKYKCKASEDIRNVLVVWDHRLFSSETSHIKVIDYKTLKIGLNKSFGNLLKYPNTDNLDAITEYIPYFEKNDVEYYKNINGVPEYDDEADFFIDDIYQNNIYRTFDLKYWETTGWSYVNNHHLIKRLDLLQILKIIYLIFEKENLRPGFLSKLMEDGTILTILKRIKEIRTINDSELSNLYSPYKKLKCCPIHDPDFYKDGEEKMDEIESRRDE